MTSALDWGEEQWNTIRRTVHDEALRTRVAASFLPLYGPLPADAQAVPLNRLEVVPGPPGTDMRLGVNDYDTRRLSTVSVNVHLKSAQVADPELASARIMFRRAASIVARLEDDIIFNGQGGVGMGPPRRDGAPAAGPPVFRISGGGEYEGLVQAGEDGAVDGGAFGAGCTGPAVFEAVVAAIQTLEGNSFLGPYACVMGNDLFRAITTPMENSMVLPRDSILPFLDGPLLRSGALPPRQAVVVSLQGAPVEIVTPSDIAATYLQTSADGEHVFRVQQKFVLRIKEPGAVSTIVF